MALYLVTGGAGFIGSHIVDELIRRGKQVRVLDNLSSGKLENLNSSLSKIELITGDIRNLATVRQAVDGVQYVLHQAALPSVPRSISDPWSSNDVNINGTLNVLIAARDAGVKRLVHASSSSVYGNSPSLVKQEDMPTNPLSPYAVAKLSGENYAAVFCKIYGLPTVILRYFNVFGPRQDPNSQYSAVIPKFVKSMLYNEAPTIYGDGTQSRDFTYVTNIVQANLLACEKDEAVGQVMNIACGKRHTLLDLFNALTKLLQINMTPIFDPPRAGDVMHSLASIDKATQFLGYKPSEDWIDGLQCTIMWHKKKLNETQCSPQRS